MNFLTPENGLVFRITHIANVPWILDHGLHCRNSVTRDPNYRDIGNPDLIAKRAHRAVLVLPGGTLADYVPFYFTPHSPMLLNIRTGYNGTKQTPMNEIVIFVVRLRRLIDLRIPFVLTDRHAYLQTAQFSNDLSGLDRIDWRILQTRDFARSPTDPGKMERYQAEALVPGRVPIEAIDEIACYGEEQAEVVRGELARRGLRLPVAVRPEWYF